MSRNLEDDKLEHFDGGVVRLVCRPCRFVQDGKSVSEFCPDCDAPMVSTVVFHRARRKRPPEDEIDIRSLMEG